MTPAGFQPLVNNPIVPGARLGVISDPPVNPMRVKKDTQPIILVLQDKTQVRGLVHLPSSGRLSDLLNHQCADRPFISLTRAAVRLPDGTHHQSPFIAVNRSAVGLCIPIQEQPAGKDGTLPGPHPTPPARPDAP